MVTAAAAFERPRCRPRIRSSARTASIVLGKTRINDHKSFGLLTFREVIAKSSNVGVIKAALIVGDQPLHSMITAFGFGRRTGIDLPGESPGIVHPVSSLEPHRQGLHLVRPGHLGDAAPARQLVRRAGQRRRRAPALPGARDRTRRCASRRPRGRTRWDAPITPQTAVTLERVLETRGHRGHRAARRRARLPRRRQDRHRGEGDPRRRLLADGAHGELRRLRAGAPAPPGVSGAARRAARARPTAATWRRRCSGR